MKSPRISAILIRTVALGGLAACAGPSQGGLFKKEQKAKTISFERDVQPILETRCLSCHHAAKASRELNLETLKLANSTWRGGPVIVAGHPSRSMLVQFLELDISGGSRSAHAISYADRAKLNTWISEGADWPETTPPLQPR